MDIKTYIQLVVVVGVVLFGGVHAAWATTFYVDGATGHNANDGLSWGSAVATIQNAISKATQEGDVIEISGGTYSENVDANKAGVTLQGSKASGHESDVILSSTTFPYTARASGVSLHNVQIQGGSTFYSKAIRTTVSDVTIQDIGINGFFGIGISLESGTTNVLIRDVEVIDSITAISGDSSVTGVLDHVIARGYAPGSTPAAMVYLSGSANLSLMNSFIVGGYRYCVKTEGSAQVTIRNSIVGGCGLEYTQNSENYSLLAVDSSVIDIDDSIVNGYIRSPHTTISSGVTLGENVPVNTFPDVEQLSANEAYFILSVDGRDAISNADALAGVAEGFGAHISYFIDSPDAFVESDWDVVKDLVARGHDIGSRARSNHLLTNNGPFQIAYTGSDTNVSMSVINSGTLFFTQGDTSIDVLGPWDLVPEYPAVDGLCQAIDAHASYSCTLTITGAALDTLPDYPSTVLQDATTALSTAPTMIPYDKRSPAQGGRFFTEALVNTKQVIEESIGGGYEVVSLGYPGQQHDETIRDMVEATGYLIARGSANIAKSDHLWTSLEDVYQTPLTLNYIQAKGTDYDTLSLSEQETRLRQFADAWAFSALQSALVGTLKVHGSDTLNTQELYWILDELTTHGVALVSLSEFRDLLDASWTTVDGRSFTKPLTDQTDYHLTFGSEQVDAGSAYASMATDADDLPLYGNPDIGPFEVQPTLELGTDLLPVGETTRVYEDGKFYSLDGSASGEADFSIEPSTGMLIFDETQARPWFADVFIDTWGFSESVESQWQEIAPSDTGSTLHTLGGFESAQVVLVFVQPEGGEQVLIAVPVSDHSGRITFLYEGGYSAPVTFLLDHDTTPPTQPALIQPSDNMMLYSTNVLLEWEEAVDTQSGPIGYVLSIDGIETETESLSTQYIAENLSCDSHEWFVVAQDAAGNQTASERGTFEVVCGRTAPSAGSGNTTDPGRPTSQTQDEQSQEEEQEEEDGIGGGGEYLLRSPITGEWEAVNEVHAASVIKSTSFSTVYYITQDFKRAPFPNEITYFTWFDSFDEIEMVTDATLSTLELALPIMPKPDVVLVKTPSTPEVYVMRDGQDDPTRPDLHWIETEEQAREWFGSLWALYVLDVDPTIISRLDVCEPCTVEDIDALLTTLTMRSLLMQRAQAG